jgi:hypothetical protein
VIAATRVETLSKEYDMIYRGWTVEEWINVAHWQMAECPCPHCITLARTIPTLIRLALMSVIAPVTEVETDAVDSLIAIQEKWMKAHKDGETPQTEVHA